MGRSIRELLVRKDPVPEHCGRVSCLPCRHKVGCCTRQGPVYKISCNTCKEIGDKESIYVGESARTLYNRGEEHRRALEQFDEESSMVEHSAEDHPGVPPDYSMEPICFSGSPLWRQAVEANEIMKNLNKNVKVLNRRGE